MLRWSNNWILLQLIKWNLVWNKASDVDKIAVYGIYTEKKNRLKVQQMDIVHIKVCKENAANTSQKIQGHMFKSYMETIENIAIESCS